MSKDDEVLEELRQIKKAKLELAEMAKSISDYDNQWALQSEAKGIEIAMDVIWRLLE